jgi:hypothetical protein
MIQPLTREEALRRALEIVAEQHRQGNLTKDQVAILNHIISDGYLRGVETDLTTEISDYARAQIERVLIDAGLMAKPRHHFHGHTGRF